MEVDFIIFLQYEFAPVAVPKGVTGGWGQFDASFSLICAVGGDSKSAVGGNPIC